MHSKGGSPRTIVLASASLLLVAASLLVPALASGGPQPDASEILPARLRFVPSGLKGGGFFTSVALAPGDEPTIILGGGNSGYHRSTDLGATSEARNADLITLPLMRLASVVYHPTRPGVVYGAAGNRGKLGGFERSIDDGLTWEVLSDVPLFSGQESGVPELPEHPRSTGTLIAAAGGPGSTTIWVATFDQGVMRSVDDGRTWEVLGLAGTYLRSLAIDPDDPDVLVTAAYGDGVYVTRDARAETVTFTPLGTAPSHTEELAFVDGALYAAGGQDGLFRFDGTDWHRLAEGVPDGSTWTAITGYPSTGGPILLAGCHACQPGPDGHHATIIRSRDGGATWHSVTRPASIDLRVIGSGERWVLADAVPSTMLGGADAIVSQLVSRAAPDGDPGAGVVLMAGRGGMWRSTDGGTSWAPAVNGLSEANSQSLAIDPREPARAFQGAAHFGLQRSLDAFRTVGVDILANGTHLDVDPQAHPTALWTAFDTSTRPSSVIIAAGDAAVPTIGGVFLNPDPFTSDAWQDLGYSATLPDHQPTSLAVGHDGQGRRVIVATVHPKGGLARKVGDGPWDQVADERILSKRSVAKSDMLWVPGTQTLYVYDLARGIYRSADAGVSWTALWDHPSDVENTGGLAVDPQQAGSLFVAAADGLFRVSDADAGSVATGEARVTRLGAYAKAADVTVDGHGLLWAAIHASEDSPVLVVASADPHAPLPTFREYSDATLQGTMVQPESLVVMKDGTVIVAGSRSGTLRGMPE